MATFQLNIQDSTANPSQLLTVTRELAATLGRQREITAQLPEGAAEPGQKGDLQAIGTILLQLAGGGGVIVSLISVLKTYFERKPTLEMELQRPDGSKLKIHAESLGSTAMNQFQDQFVEKIQHFLSE